MHPTVRNLVVLNTLDASSELLFGLMQVQPSPARKTVLDTFVKTLKSAGIWQKLDLLYVLAAHDAQAARLNWIDPARFALAVTGSPVFAADQGYTGHPASSAVLTATGYSPSTNTAKLTQNSATLGIFTRTVASYDGATSRIDLYTNQGRMQRRPTNSAQYFYRINDGTSGAPTPAALTGHFATRRTGASESSIWREGSSIANDTTASTGVASSFVLFGLTSNFSDAQLSVAYGGSSLDDTQMAAMNTAIAALKTGIGF